MEKFKLNLNREKLSSEQIQNYQNFNQLKSDFKLINKSSWKNPWLLGVGGVASVTVILTIGVVMYDKTKKNEIKITQTESNTAHVAAQEINSESFSKEKVIEHTESDASQVVLVADNQKPVRAQATSNVSKPKQKKTLKLDVLAKEFPELEPLINSELEIMDESAFDAKWFQRTWDDVSLVALKSDMYLIKFSVDKEVNKLVVKKI